MAILKYKDQNGNYQELKFLNTVNTAEQIGTATTSSNGLMSKEDKSKLDGITTAVTNTTKSLSFSDGLGKTGTMQLTAYKFMRMVFLSATVTYQGEFNSDDFSFSTGLANEYLPIADAPFTVVGYVQVPSALSIKTNGQINGLINEAYGTSGTFKCTATYISKS